MSLNYDKIKAKEEGDGTQWTSYSDLFMVLSFVFLLLYVVSSLRNGAFSFQNQMQQNKTSKELSQLQATERAYNSLVNNRLEEKADDKEQELYHELMAKLSLLQEKSKVEKDDLRQAALDNEKKEMALNKYQQIIRNIINTNMLAKGRIERRDEVIQEKSETIEEKEDIIVEQDDTIEEKTEVIAQKEKTIEIKEQLIEQKQKDIAQKQKVLERKEHEISSLNQSIESQNNTISQNNQKINNINSALDKKIKALKETQKKFKTDKKKMAAKVAQLKRNTEKQVGALKNKNKLAEKNLKIVNTRLETASLQLNSAENSIQQAHNVIAEQERQKEQLANELQAKALQYSAQMEKLKSVHDSKMKAEKVAFMKNLKSQRLSARAKAKKLAQFKKAAEAKEAALGKKLNALTSKVSESQEKLKDSQAKAAAAAQRALAAGAQAKKLESKNVQLAEDLKKAQAKAAAKAKIVQDIQKNLKSAGVNAKIDAKSGEVVLSFGKEYFDAGKAELKGQMMKAIEKFMPVYTKSLFKNPAIAKKIKNIEIIGFSSPTYKGKYVDPQSLGLKDRLAMGYNLTLSFKRAKSIFNHVTDPKRMKFSEQKTLLPYLKVSGRSFLAEETKGRNLASGISAKKYCKKYDCKKSQRVIIKFTLKD